MQCLKADLRGGQLLCEAGALLDEVLSGCVASAQVVLHAGLCGFHLIDFDRLLRQLPPEVRDRLVALFDLCTGDLAVVDGVAQLRFQGRLGLCAGLSGRKLGGIGPAAYANPIGVETESDKKQNPGGREHPHVAPGRVTGKWQGSEWACGDSVRVFTFARPAVFFPRKRSKKAFSACSWDQDRPYSMHSDGSLPPIAGIA